MPPMKALESVVKIEGSEKTTVTGASDESSGYLQKALYGGAGLLAGMLLLSGNSGGAESINYYHPISYK